MMHRRISLGDLTEDIRAATVAAALRNRTGTGTTATPAATAAAATLRAGITNAAGGQSPEDRATQVRQAGVVGAVIGGLLSLGSAAASAAGGSTGQWISFILGGPAPAVSTTIALGDLNSLKDWVTNIVNTVGPMMRPLLSGDDVNAKQAAIFFIGTDGNSGYLNAVKTTVTNAWTVANTPAPAVPAVPETPPRDWGNGNTANRTTTDSNSSLVLPLGAIAVAIAAYFFMKK